MPNCDKKGVENSAGHDRTNEIVEVVNKENLDEDRVTVKFVRKNILMISLLFLLHFTAFGGLLRLQSSLHIDEGLGVISQAVLYATLTVSCLSVPKLMISKLGHKWTLTISLIGYIIWMAANAYAVWWTMIPSSFLVGLAAAPLWTAKCTYFAILAPAYAKLTGDTTEGVMGNFFGLFFAIVQCSGIIGSVISSTVLNPRDDNYTGPTDEEIEYCGLNDCPWNNATNVNYEGPEDYVIWILVGIYIGIALIGFTISAIFVDKLPEYLVRDLKTENTKDEIFKLLGATVKHMRHINQLLLIIITMYSGFEQTFLSAEYNKSWVTCNLGIWWVGWVSIPYAVMNALTCFSTGYLVKYTGRVPIFATACLVEFGIHMILLFWVPYPDDMFLMFLIPILWGFTDGIWQTQINSLYGVIFPNESEAAFSNYRLWESVGFTIAYAYSFYLCTSTKLYILMAVFLSGMLGYFTVEIREFRKKGEVDDSVPEGSVVETTKL